ncbi:hypothetical protein E2562_030761 [Oryza meyeriana var. granulata]|uniref:C2H2-type domain-containing protein n=1 Tax=Oryza meyeriana var. granulata TaxID=110450 RepID=A0A6G1C9R5_9ORYZ|nr:hypothetical protein E2562_030761 [Oryza meyeriana var. granulata]
MDDQEDDCTRLQLEEEDDEHSQLEEHDVQLSLACGDEDDAAPRPRKRRRRREESAFECRTCGRRFASHQALGGHRTSHLRPTSTKRRPGPSRPVVHSCEVCGMGFEMGQALGGHMRRHRPISNVDLGLKQIVVPEIRPSSNLQLLNLFA